MNCVTARPFNGYQFVTPIFKQPERKANNEAQITHINSLLDAKTFHHQKAFLMLIPPGWGVTSIPEPTVISIRLFVTD